MSERNKIILMYVVVFLISVSVIATSLWIRNERKKRDAARLFVDVYAPQVEDFGTLETDLEATNQDDETVRLSDLKGKVWIATNFFANCPYCLRTSEEDLKKLYDEFGNEPDFHIVSITVNPADDTVEQLRAYADAMGARTSNWWFLRGPKEEIHDYIEKEMKFLAVEENPGTAEPFSHDRGLQVYGRNWNRVKKRDLHWAREEGGEGRHQEYFEELRASIRKALAAKTEAPAGEGETQ